MYVPAARFGCIKYREISAFLAIRYMGTPDASEMNRTFPFCGHFSTG
jgi:hypothetical protein